MLEVTPLSLLFSIHSLAFLVPIFYKTFRSVAGPLLYLTGNLFTGSVPKWIEQPKTNRQSSPAREEAAVPESELDIDTRRRLLILPPKIARGNAYNKTHLLCLIFAA
ncbi:hypothetical protein RJT34_20165 [Clitoria ternatea]|uniref:Uncharacterized protein n=1 Tax=Clitoria ternatea TaxID=43366 RepID=A0AAN9P4N5_CLITE